MFTHRELAWNYCISWQTFDFSKTWGPCLVWKHTWFASSSWFHWHVPCACYCAHMYSFAAIYKTEKVVCEWNNNGHEKGSESVERVKWIRGAPLLNVPNGAFFSPFSKDFPFSPLDYISAWLIVVIYDEKRRPMYLPLPYWPSNVALRKVSCDGIEGRRDSRSKPVSHCSSGGRRYTPWKNIWKGELNLRIWSYFFQTRSLRFQTRSATLRGFLSSLLHLQYL